MADGETKYPLGSPLQHVKICEEHDSIIDILCEECYAFICSICARLNHNGHNWVTQATAALQRRRGIHEHLVNIKKEKISKLDKEIQKMVSQMEENEGMCDTQVKDLQRHYDDTILKLIDIKKNQKDVLKDNLRKTNETIKNAKHNLEKIRKSIIDIVDFMVENNSTISDFSLIESHRQLEELLCEMNRYFNNCGNTARYIRGEFEEDMLENMIGRIVELDDICHAETSSFKYVEDGIAFLQAYCEDEYYIKYIQTDCIDEVNKQGKLKRQIKICPAGVCVTDNGNVYITDNEKNSICRLFPSGYISTIFSTTPLIPDGICRSVDGGLFVTLRDNESPVFQLNNCSRRLVKKITLTGADEFEFQKGTQTRLFTWPIRVLQNRNTDICVVNLTSDTTGEIVIVTPSGHLKTVYHGQDLIGRFCPFNIECDIHSNILVTDPANHTIHLLSPDGEFMKYLLTEREVTRPSAISLHKSTLWIGDFNGRVKVFQYNHTQ
ncbi:uncharacterized protein LOC134249004 [Saccostrea cucullata]|uniref:uncharacterized protein LOC134249004 n=1 Tax=Saccostrea cuccullata TaxID=36930 RepID=UPI002ED06DF7